MKIKKKRGSTEAFICSMAFIMVALVIIMMLRLKIVKVTKNMVEDGLVASNLASATIDLNEYGSTNNIVISSFEKNFNDYCISLKDNLNLNNDFTPKNNTLINSKVDIHEFTIYNVKGNDIEMIKRQADGSITRQSYINQVGIMQTPDGSTITTTTIYSKIGFEVKGYLDNTLYIYKEKSVDITDN